MHLEPDRLSTTNELGGVVEPEIERLAARSIYGFHRCESALSRHAFQKPGQLTGICSVSLRNRIENNPSGREGGQSALKFFSRCGRRACRAVTDCSLDETLHRILIIYLQNDMVAHRRIPWPDLDRCDPGIL